jgi:hypothetical protein
MRIFLLAAGLLISNVNAAPIGDIFQSEKRWVTCGKISANATGKLDIAENEGTAIITNAPNPLFPALRSGPTAASGASRQKQIPSSDTSTTWRSSSRGSARAA